MRFNDRGIRFVLASVLSAVAFAVLIAAAPTLAQPFAASASVPTWSPASSFASVSIAARASGARPAITRLSSASAKPGISVTITGSGFGSRRGTSSVLFGAFKSTSYVRWSAKRIICKVPGIPAAKLTIKVRTAKGTSNGKSFTVKALPTVVLDTTEVLSTDTAASASTTDGSTYGFADTSQTSSLAPGDVIIGKPTASLPEGIFGKVTAVGDGGGSVGTEPASLEDVFTSAQFSADHPITQSDFTDAAAAAGVRLMQSVVVRPHTRLLTFRLTDASVSKSADVSTDFGPVAVSGTITLKITVHVAGAVDWGGVKSFETSETTTVSSDLKASVTKELSFDAEKTLASWGAGQLAGFTVMVGPVPLYFQPELAIFVGVNGQFTAGAETAVHYEASGTVGLRYQAPTFSTWTQVSSKKSYTPPTLFASGSVKAYAGAQLGLKLYAAAGPYMRMDGYAKLAADTRQTPWWTLKAGVEARMGAQIGINVGFIHWNKDWKSGDLKLAEWTLAQATTPPPPTDGTIAGSVQDTGGSPLDGVTVIVSDGATTIASTISSADGSFVVNVASGSGYTVTFSKDGYVSDARSGIDVSPNETTTLDPVTLAALPNPGETRIVLTWGYDPPDLDSHLVGPSLDGSLFHVYFEQLGDSSYAALDHDCTTGYGPETTTIYSQVGGIYTFAVHDYSNRDSTDSWALSQSGATVQVFQGDVLAATFGVPPDSPGTLWTVFTMEGSVIRPVNTMSYESDPAAVLMPASTVLPFTPEKQTKTKTTQ